MKFITQNNNNKKDCFFKEEEKNLFEKPSILDHLLKHF